jgi:hypothetical protein
MFPPEGELCGTGHIVEIQDVFYVFTDPLCATSTPSGMTAVCIVQFALPPVATVCAAPMSRLGHNRTTSKQRGRHASVPCPLVKEDQFCPV